MLTVIFFASFNDSWDSFSTRRFFSKFSSVSTTLWSLCLPLLLHTAHTNTLQSSQKKEFNSECKSHVFLSCSSKFSSICPGNRKFTQDFTQIFPKKSHLPICISLCLAKLMVFICNLLKHAWQKNKAHVWQTRSVTISEHSLHKCPLALLLCIFFCCTYSW